MVEVQKRPWRTQLLELIGAWSVAIAYPAVQGATSGPDAFTLAAFDGIDVIIFLIVLILPAPLLAAAIEALIRLRFPRIAIGLHVSLISLCLAVLVWQLVQSATDSALPRNLLPLVALVLVAWSYIRFDPFRQVLSVLAFAPIAIVAVTLFSDPARSTVLPTGHTESKSETRADPPIVMLVLDELPLVALLDEEGEIDGRIFPGFSELARNTTWYPEARATADFTVRALPAILTGKAPAKERIPATQRNYPENLFTILGDSGYQVAAQETRTTLCPKSLCPSRDSRLAKLVLALENGANYGDVFPDNLDARALMKLTARLPRVDRDQAAHLREFIETSDPQPASLDFLHVELPHFPWQLFPDGHSHNGPYYAGMVEGSGPRADATWASPLADQAMQRMMLQLVFVDRQIGRLLDRLKSSRHWDEMIFVVMADHGAGFEQGVERRHISERSAGWQLPVPLFVKHMGQRKGEVVEGPVSTSDVTPTILEELGLPLPEGAVGVPLGERSDSELPTPVSYYGDLIEVSEDQLKKELRDALTRRNELFGSGDLYALAGESELIGQPVEKVDLEELKVEVDPLGHLHEIDLDSDEISSYWSGYVREGIRPTSGRIAIAVNGRIATTVPTWQDPEGSDVWRVEAILPPEFLRNGENEVVAFALP